MERLLGYRLANMQGVGARARQEDSFTTANAFDVVKLKEEGLLFAVFDGMGGMKDGKLASETAVQSMRASFAAMDRHEDLAPQLKNAVFAASEAVEAVIGGDGGSTAIVCIIFEEKLYFASVGDSYLFLKRGDGLYRLNQEHNVFHDEYLSAIRCGDLDGKACREVDEATALTQFLGKVGMDDVDACVRPLPLKEGDILLACSDGVGGVLDEDELKIALSFKSERAMCQQLEQRLVIHARQFQDNYTALVVKCVY